MTTKNYIILLLMLFSSILLSASDIDRIMEQSGVKINTSSANDKVEKREAKKSVYNYQEVVYQRLMDNERAQGSPKQANEVSSFAAKNVEIQKKKIAALSKKYRASKQKSDKKKSYVSFASGYCYTETEITVERLATYAYLSCDFEKPIGHATLALSVSPDFYAKALIGTPMYIQKGKYRLPIVSGAVLTKDKNSINIANVVNDRKIAKITTMGVYTTFSVATKTAQEYLKMKQEAATTTSTDTIATTSGTTTVTATNTSEIPIENYLVSGAIQLVSELAKVVGEVMINDLPYTFKIYKNSVFYVDLELSGDENILGVRAVLKDGNMAVREPIFRLDGTFDDPESTEVIQREIKRERK